MLILTALNGSHRGSVFEFPPPAASRAVPAPGLPASDNPDPHSITLGRKAGPIPFNSSKVSGLHAELSFDGGQWFVRDLGSRNGTRVNRRPISEKTQIKSGDLLQIARHYFACSITQSLSSHETSQDDVPPPPALPRNLDEPRVSSEAIEATVTTAVVAARDAVVTNLAEHETLLQQVLARLHDQDQRHGQLAALLEDARRSSPPDARPLLENIAGEIQSQADKHRQSLDAVWKALEQPSDTAPLLAAIRADLESQTNQHRQLLIAMQAAVESQTARTVPLIEKIHARLDEQDGRRQELLNGVRDAVKTESAQTAPALEKIRAAIEVNVAKQDQAAASVRQVVETEAAKTQPLLEKIQTSLDAQSARQQEAITNVQRAVDAAAVKTQPVLEKIQAGLDAQVARQKQAIANVQRIVEVEAAKATPVLEKIQATLDAHGAARGETVAAVERVVQTEAARRQPLLEKIQTSLDAQGAKQEQVVAAVQQAVRTETGGVQPLLEKIGSLLAGERERHAELVTAVRTAATAEPVNFAPLLEQITTTLNAQESRHAQGLSELRETLAALPGASAAAAAALEPKLDQVTSQIADRLAGQVEVQSSRHAELVATIKSLAETQPASTEPLLKNITDRLDAQANRHAELLDAIRQVQAAASTPPPQPEPVAPLLEQITLKLAAQESRHGQVMAAVQSLAAAQPVAAERMVKPIMTLLEAQASRQAALVSAVQALAAADAKPVPTDPLLRRVAEQVESQASQQADLIAAVQAVAAAASRPPAPVVVTQAPALPLELPESLRNLPNIEPQLGVIADMLRGQASRQGELLAAVQAMAAHEPRAVATDPLLRRVAEQVESQAGRQELILAALHQPQAGGPALERIVEKLDAQAARQEALATRVEDSIKAAAAPRDDATLEGLTAQLAAQWAQVREAIQTDKPQPLLESVAAQLKAQEAQQTVMMERIHEELSTTAKRSDPHVQHMVAKLETLQAQLEHLTGVVRQMTLNAQSQSPPQTHVLRLTGGENPPRVVEPTVVTITQAARPRRVLRTAAAAVAALLLLAGLISVGVWERSQLLSLQHNIANQLADRDKIVDTFKAQSARSESLLREMSQQAVADRNARWMAILTPPTQDDDDALDIHPLTPLAPVAPAPGIPGTPGIGSELADANPAPSDDALSNSTAANYPGGYSAGYSGGGTLLGQFRPDSSTQIMTAPPAPRRASLTSLQKAFRYAFDTGWPIVVGGKMDPLTGKLAGGRTLDPATARRLGFKTWAEWYNFDDANEKLRLQQAAQDFLQDRRLNPIRYLPPQAAPAAPAPQDAASE